MTVLAYQALFEVPIPAGVSAPRVYGFDLFNNPPTKQPNFKAAAMVATGVALVLEPAGQTIPWRNDGWETTLHQPNHPRPERSAAIARGTDGIEAPKLGWVTIGWPVQPWQPPHYGVEKKGAFLRGTDGTEAPFQFWRNDGWEATLHQPQHPRPERFGAIARGDDGIEAQYVYFVPSIPWVLDPYFQPPRQWQERRAAGTMRGDDGIQYTLPPAPFSEGWQVQPWQPPHPRPERFGALAKGHEGIDDRYVFFIASIPWTLDILFQPPRLWPERRAAGIMRGDDGIQAIMRGWVNDGWEIQPPQPPRAPQKQKMFAAIARGDDGIQFPFIFRFFGQWRATTMSQRHDFPFHAIFPGGWVAKSTSTAKPNTFLGAPISIIMTASSKGRFAHAVGAALGWWAKATSWIGPSTRPPSAPSGVSPLFTAAIHAPKYFYTGITAFFRRP